MSARLIRRDEIPSLIDFGKEELLQVELTSDGILIRRAEDQLDPETVKLIAEGEELCGY